MVRMNNSILPLQVDAITFTRPDQFDELANFSQ